MSVTGDRIKELRILHDMTQEELGNKIGVKKAAINKYELGIVENIKRHTILTLANVLDTTPNYLMGWEDEDVQEDEPIVTLAAHATEDLTEEEQQKVIDFVKFIKSQRGANEK